MTIPEMQAIAAGTLALFIKAMPDCPFTAEDIIIEFCPRKKMTERARALCAKYVPEKIINDSQATELVTSVGANALIGREKSAIIARIGYRDEMDLRCVIFHELTHIFCAKLEMDESEHFIEVYGSGTTPEREMTAIEKAADGMLVAGYQVWSEFIAQYYMTKHLETQPRKIKQVAEYIDELLGEVGHAESKDEKYAVSFACARFFTCTDAEEYIAYIKENEEDFADLRTYHNILFFIHEQLQKEKPWVITEEFIAGLGERFLLFKVTNSDLGDLMNQLGGLQ